VITAERWAELYRQEFPRVTLAASWTAGALQVHAYYIERVDRLLVLKYATGPENDRPAGVTEADFQRTVQLIGLVPVLRGS
jgi:hypothetical protein